MHNYRRALYLPHQKHEVNHNKGYAMDLQTAFNIAIGIIGMFGGWFMNNIWSSVKDLQTADKQLADKVSHIEVLVAGKYVTRDEMDKTAGVIFNKLDRILDVLNSKADKPNGGH